MTDKFLSVPFPRLDFARIVKECPVAVAKIGAWLINHDGFREGMLTTGADITDMKTLNIVVEGIIRFDPRKLYDIFDSLGVRIFVTDGGESADRENPIFYYYNSVLRISSSASSRIEAEQQAFMDAFQILNREDDKKEQIPDTHS